MILYLLLSLFGSPLENGVRSLKASSCEVIPLKLALGVTTQIVFEQEPSVTLYADEQHFKIQSTPNVPRSIAVIPQFSQSELDSLIKSSGSKNLDQEGLAKVLDHYFKTNLFVFFDSSSQLMFELKFVEPSKADYILKVQQKFTKECLL